MTSNPNGWPDPARPGVPLNPERDSVHWLQWAGQNNRNSPDRPVTWEWAAFWQKWGDLSDTVFPKEMAERGWRYLGPCLLPSEVAEQIAAARRAALEEAARLIDANTATWPHVGPVPAQVRGEWALRDKLRGAVVAAIRALKEPPR